MTDPDDVPQLDAAWFAKARVSPAIGDDNNPEWIDADFARARSARDALPPQVVAAFHRGTAGGPARDADEAEGDA